MTTHAEGTESAESEAPANIVDIAAGSDAFGLLVRALDAAGLTETVRGLDDVTVFAPTDAAFAALAADLGYAGDPADEDAVFDALVAALTDLGDVLEHPRLRRRFGGGGEGERQTGEGGADELKKPQGDPPDRSYRVGLDVRCRGRSSDRRRPAAR